MSKNGAACNKLEKRSNLIKVQYMSESFKLLNLPRILYQQFFFFFNYQFHNCILFIMQMGLCLA